MNEFARMLEAEIPRLRRYARAPTRDIVRADDLVQSCLTRAVAKQHLWQYGTDLPLGFSRLCTISPQHV
jgi:RNA polymerase sigma-70 factor (ECF subfamily)